MTVSELVGKEKLSVISAFIAACWLVILQLAPWLLVGTVLSGLLFVFLPPDLIRKRFQGFGGILKSVGLGIPLPLCSCGVIPAGISLKKQGASDGAAVGFLISTPQTGVDSILVSSSFFGWGFALVKMLAAAVTGVFGGLLADRLVDPAKAETMISESRDVVTEPRGWSGFVAHCLEILRSIWGWLLIGVFVSAAIENFVPKHWFAQVNELGVVASMLLALLISTPLYVCATASVPIAASLVAGGLSPAAAMVFLMAGPATNVTTIGAVQSQFGWRTTLVYLGSILTGSMLAGWLFESTLGVHLSESAHQHHHNQWWEQLSGGVLVFLMVWFAGESLWRKYQVATHKAGDSSDATQWEIEGMHCEGCVRKLESGLKQIDGVHGVLVDLTSETATVNGAVDRNKIHQVVTSLGFQLKSEVEEIQKL